MKDPIYNAVISLTMSDADWRELTRLMRPHNDRLASLMEKLGQQQEIRDVPIAAREVILFAKVTEGIDKFEPFRRELGVNIGGSWSIERTMAFKLREVSI